MRKNRYPLSLIKAKKLPKPIQIKYLKALVYDVLKRTHNLDLFYDCYAVCHYPQLTLEEANKHGVINDILIKASTYVVDNDIYWRDFFYNTHASVGFNEYTKSKGFGKLDNIWCYLMDKEINS